MNLADAIDRGEPELQPLLLQLRARATELGATQKASLIGEVKQGSLLIAEFRKEASRFRDFLRALGPDKVERLLYGEFGRLRDYHKLYERVMQGKARRGPLSITEFLADPSSQLEFYPHTLSKDVTGIAKRIQKAYPGMHVVTGLGSGAESGVLRVVPSRQMRRELGVNNPVVLKFGKTDPQSVDIRKFVERGGNVLPTWQSKQLKPGFSSNDPAIHTWLEPEVRVRGNRYGDPEGRLDNVDMQKVRRTLERANLNTFDLHLRQLGDWKGKTYLIDRGVPENPTKSASLIDEVKRRALAHGA